MAFVNENENAVMLNMVYFGPPGSGTSSIVKCLAQKLGARSEPPPLEISIWEMGKLKDVLIKVALVGRISTKKELAQKMLSEADVIFFVADSTPGSQGRNRQAWDRLQSYLLEDKQIVLLLNKTDAGAEEFHPGTGEISVYRCSAITGEGVVESLRMAVGDTLKRLT